MFVLITYDVNITSESGAKRLRDVARICKNYGIRVQNSVFECLVTEVQLLRIKQQLKEVMDLDQDSIRFYILGNNWKRKVDMLGKDTGTNFMEELII